MTWWTSDELRQCNALGYSYPELDKSAGNVASLRQWVTEHYEWTTISGESPPRQTLAEVVGTLSKIEALPDPVRIDGTGQPVDKAPRPDLNNQPKEEKGFFARTFGSSEPRKNDKRPQDRYQHIRPLISNGTLLHWNLTIRVEKLVHNITMT